MFSTTTEYALRAAVFLSEAGSQNQTSQRVAEATKVPVQYMSKVLQMLAEAGVATSQRGPTGGFALARDARQITLLDVVSAVEPVQRILECPLGLPEHAAQLCPLHRVMDDLARITEEHLRSRTLADVMAEPVVPLGMTAKPRSKVDSSRDGQEGSSAPGPTTFDSQSTSRRS